MAEVERVHSTYGSTFGHEFRNRVTAAGQDRRRGSGQDRPASQKPADQDSVELHEVSEETFSTERIETASDDGHIDFSA